MPDTKADLRTTLNADHDARRPHAIQTLADRIRSQTRDDLSETVDVLVILRDRNSQTYALSTNVRPDEVFELLNRAT